MFEAMFKDSERLSTLAGVSFAVLFQSVGHQYAWKDKESRSFY